MLPVAVELLMVSPLPLPVGMMPVERFYGGAGGVDVE